MDPRRPKSLKEEEKFTVCHGQEFQRLQSDKDELYKQLRENYGTIEKAKIKGVPAWKQYHEMGLTLNRWKKATERQMLKQLQEDYDATAPVKDIRAQLAGQPVSVLPSSTGPATYAFEERARLAQYFLDPPTDTSDLQWRVAVVNNLVGLCTKQEIRYRKKRVVRRVESSSDCTIDSSDSESSESEGDLNTSDRLRCHPFQYLYCLEAPALSSEAQNYPFASEYSLERHISSVHGFKPG